MVDQEVYKAKLSELRKALVDLDQSASQSASPVELDQSRVGRLSRMDAMQAQAMSIESGRRRAEHVRRIDAALWRMENGDYGLCTQCDEEIEVGRLDYDPATPMCINCASRSAPDD